MGHEHDHRKRGNGHWQDGANIRPFSQCPKRPALKRKVIVPRMQHVTFLQQNQNLNTMFLAKKTLDSLVAGAPMNASLCCRLTVMLHSGSLFSTAVYENARLRCVFANFASTKFNMPAVHITRMLEAVPTLQRLRTLLNVEQFIHMLNKRGFTELQIAKIIRLQPSLMLTNTERILEPKIKLIEDIGIQGQKLARILTADPRILTSSLEKDLLPKIGLLKSVFQSQDLLARSLLRAPTILRCDLEKILEPSVAFWKEWGFQGAELSSFVEKRPQVLFHASLTPAQVDLIHKTGVDKSSKMFKYIVGVVAVSPMETVQAKIENLKLCGWTSSEEIWQLIRAAPFILLYSKENVSVKMNFLVNNMKVPASYVAERPWLLYFSFEKKLRPRFLVLQRIKALNELDFAISTVLQMSEAMFINKFIEGHPESETLRTIYENAISNASNRIKKSSH